MSQNLKNHARSITRIEDTRASEGAFAPGDDSIERSVHESQVQQWDTRKALAISSLNRDEAPISWVRSLLQRGNFSQAHEAITIFEFQGNLDTETRTQIIFEKIRLAFFESDWPLVIRTSDQALSLKPAPTVRLAIHQLKANAHFELGDFSHCGTEIEEAEILGQMFPYAVSLLYVQTLKVRLTARDRSIATAQSLLDRILSHRQRAKRLDLDLALTVLRVQIDLNRLSGKAFALESAACFLISDAIGDKLYCGLAELDYYSGQAKRAIDLSELVSPEAKKFIRVKNMLNEIAGDAASVSAQTIFSHLGQSAGDENKLPSFPYADQFKNTVMLYQAPGSKINLVLNLRNKAMHAFPAGGQVFAAIQAIASGHAEKSEFFAELWGKQKYAPRLHDTLISSVLYRIKKDLQLDFTVKDGMIHADVEFLVVK